MKTIKNLFLFLVAIATFTFASCTKEGIGGGPVVLSAMIPTAGHAYVDHKPGRALNIPYGGAVSGVFTLVTGRDINGIYGYAGHGGDDLKDQTDNLWNTVANEFYRMYGYNAPEYAYVIDMTGSYSDPYYAFVADGINGYVINPNVRRSNPELHIQIVKSIEKSFEKMKNSSDPEMQASYALLMKSYDAVDPKTGEPMMNFETRNLIEHGRFESK